MKLKVKPQAIPAANLLTFNMRRTDVDASGNQLGETALAFSIGGSPEVILSRDFIARMELYRDKGPEALQTSETVKVVRPKKAKKKAKRR